VRIGIGILLLIISYQLSGQIVSVAIPEKDTAEVGELIKINYRVNVPYENAIRSLSLINLDSMLNVNEMFKDSTADLQYADFEIQDYGTWPVNQKEYKPTSNEWTSNNGRLSYNVYLVGRIWDYGVFEIPGLHVDIDTASMATQMRTGKKRIFVLPPTDYVHQDTTTAIAGIKPIIVEPANWTDYLWIAYFLLAIAFCFLAYYLYKKMQRPEPLEEVSEPVVIRAAHEIALEKLDVLKEGKMWEKGEIKEYQSNLTFVAREYLENRYKIPALESTTDEILEQLKAVEFPDVHERDLKEILTMADLVKFAKARPSGNIHQEFLEKTYDLVYHTKRDRTLEEDE